MADELRHAAGRASYEVREIHGEDRAVGLGILFRCTDYGRAVEFAFDYLTRRDPRREGTVEGLEVFKNDSGKREAVWSYRHAALAGRFDPARKWGYDVTKSWQLPATSVRPLRLTGRISRRA
jgi:hypothetical protein